MRIISWNIGGLNYLNKCDKVRAFFKDYSIDIALLQETKIECPDNRFYRRLGGFHFRKWACLPSMGAFGGLLIGWRGNYFKMLQCISKQLITCYFH